MNLNKYILSLGLVTAIVSGPAAIAGDKKQEQQAKENTDKSSSTEKSKKFTGTILEHKVVNVFESKQAEQQAQEGKKTEPKNKTLVTLVKTDKGHERLIVDLGTVDQVPEIKDGETKLKAEGRLIQIGQRQLFVATKAQVGDKTITIKRQKG